MRFNRLRFLVASMFAMLLAAAAFAPAATGASASDPGYWHFGPPNEMVLDGNTLYLGGFFTRLDGKTGASARIDATTGEASPDWPRMDGSVYAMVADGVGGWFIGGTFTQVGGFARTNLARIRADLTVDDWNPGCDGRVRVLERAGGTLYVGGEYTTLGGVARRNIAAVDIASGAVTNWNPGMPNGGRIDAILASDTTIYLGGSFLRVGSQIRHQAAAVHSETGAVLPWNPGLGSIAFVYSLALDAGRVYLGGSFSSVQGQPRSNLASVDATSGALTTWNPSANSEVLALESDGGTLYVGGGFKSIAGWLRSGLAAFDLATGALSGWNPEICQGVGEIAVQGGTLFIASHPEQACGSTLTALDKLTGVVSSWDPHPRGPVHALVVDGAYVYAGGDFKSIGGALRGGLAAIDVTTNQVTEWGPREPVAWVEAMDFGGGRVYVIGLVETDDGTFQRQVVALDAATGAHILWSVPLTRDEGFSDGPALKFFDGRLYIGGNFTAVNGVPRTYMAALDAASGALLPWDPHILPTLYLGQVTGIEVYQGVIYACGNFDTVGGFVRQGVVALDALTGLVTSWHPRIMFGNASRVDVIGGLIYLSGSFRVAVGVQAVDRAGIAAFHPVTAELMPWSPLTGPTTVVSVQPFGNLLYLYGDFHAMDPAGRSELEVVDLETGLPQLWRPELLQGSVSGIAIAGSWAYIAGDFVDPEFPPGPSVTLLRVPLPVPGPETPVVHLLSPNGGEAAILGESLTLTWTATHSVGVESVDIFLSRGGPTGPWEVLAAGIPNSGAWTWAVEGAGSDHNAYVYICAHDASGAIGRDANDASFTISTPPTPTLVELFQLEDGPDGVSIRWRYDDRSGISSLSPQRASSEDGDWTSVSGVMQHTAPGWLMLDRDVESGATVWYRLAGTMADGRAYFEPPLSVRHDGVLSLGLDPVAPNPLNDQGQVSFALVRSGHVRLTLVDVQGREVAALSDGERTAGRHVARLLVRDLPAGLYFLRMDSGAAVRQQRVVIIH